MTSHLACPPSKHVVWGNSMMGLGLASGRWSFLGLRAYFVPSLGFIEWDLASRKSMNDRGDILDRLVSNNESKIRSLKVGS